MTNRFDEDILKRKGFVQGPDGNWHKPKKLIEEERAIVETFPQKEAVQGAMGLFIPFNVPSSKNSRSPLIKKRSKGIELPPSKWTAFLPKNDLTIKYIRNTEEYYISKKQAFRGILQGKEPPYTIAMHFVRTDRRKFDHHNVCQIVFDLMEKNGWIADDSAYTVVPDFSRGFSVDKQNPGVWIDVL